MSDSLLEELVDRFDRVERAILGEPSVGHTGIVTRMERVEDEHRKIPEVHAAIAQNRIDGDKRVHNRIDEIETQTRDRLDSIEKKLDRALWLAAGGVLGGGVIGGGSVWAILGG